MTEEKLQRLIEQLRKLPAETEWAEFKTNNSDPQKIGEYISALSNSACLVGEQSGYLVWGIENDSHEIVGTHFSPGIAKKGNEPLEHWLVRGLEPSLNIRFHCLAEDRRVVVLEIPAAAYLPVRFSGVPYIRVGSVKKRLDAYPEKERALWTKINSIRFEDGIALDCLDSDQVLGKLEYTKYFELMGLPLPSDKSGIIEGLIADRLVVDKLDGLAITNVGAILFAKNLADFDRLSRKALRVIQYEGKNNIHTIREQPGTKGYAVGFEGAVQFINNLLPQNEEIGQALRTNVRMYPEIAIRELVANALIHQDFTLTGAGPMVEIFSDRIEITNPGKPLVEALRMMDKPPRSRNEVLGSLMRRMNICEERGTGINKVVFEVEVYQLPAPRFDGDSGDHFKATLYAHRKLREMSKEDRIRACFQHACLKWVSNEFMTNASLRARFNIEQSNAAQASRIIADALDAEVIKPNDPESSTRKHKKYIPFFV